MKKWFIKSISLISAVFITALSFTGCGSTATTSANAKEASNEEATGVTATKIRVATQPGVYAANILWAKKNGYFEEELEKLGYSDIEVTWDSFESGPPENEAFAAGEEDIGLIGDVPLLIAKASGQNTVTFAKLSAGETTVALTLPEDSDITDSAQLKGKKIAYVKGSYGQHFLGLVLKNAGLTFDDIEEVNLPNSDIGNAVASKQVDAGIIWEPGLTATLATGKIKVLLDGTGIKSNNVFFFATQSFADENPDALIAYIKAVERANEDIKNNPQQVAESLTEEINLPAETLEELFVKYDFSTYISESDIEELKDVEQFNREQGFAENSVDVDNFVNLQYLQDAGITGK
ncbi:MAG: aliphatic sulfonate ABC transporter substrate-binding protein [Pseudobutyrivibrio ruminis]|nr:aliphatic sulfonate ABC transporter substrate-binding protein [Pseudobutyrivibrio ruminis]